MENKKDFNESNLKIVYVPMIPILEKNQVIELDESKAGELDITARLPEVGELVLKAKTYEIVYDENNNIIERIDEKTGKVIYSKKKKKKKKIIQDEIER